jgi:hypothetical protein
MKTADLITSYLNNEMTPEQERQFLLSVAASDSLRLSLKSHVMLDRMATQQLQRAHVPTVVRDAIFAEMSASMAGSGSPAQPSASHAAGRGGSMGSFFRKLGSGAFVVVMAASGFVASYLTHSHLVESAPQSAGTEEVRMVAPEQNPMLPSVTATPEYQDAARNSTGSVSAAEAVDANVDAAETTDAEELAVASRTHRMAQTRDERSPGITRSATPREVNRSAKSVNRVQERSATVQGPLSDPLEPAGGLKRSSNSPVSAGVSLSDSLSRAASPMQQPAASVKAIIRSSKDSKQSQQGD